MPNSWTHRVARVPMRLLVNTPVTPNHLTTARLVSGVAASLMLALGTPFGNAWAGGLWLASAFLDRADGELARLSGRCTPGGHRFDYLADISVNSLFFLALGVGQRHGRLGESAILLGVLASAAMVGACWIAEAFEKMNPSGGKTLEGRWGFDADDALYLLGPLCWAGSSVLSVCTVLAALGTTGFMFLFVARYLGARRGAALGGPAAG